MRHGHDPTPAARFDAATTDAAFADASAARVSHVLLVDRKQRLLLRRTSAPGLPHGGQLTSSVVARVEAGESYEAAAVRGLRAMLGRRAHEPRHVDRSWIDRDGGRTFLGIFVALHDAETPATHVAMPVAEVLRAARLDDRLLEGAFLRVLKAIVGDREMW
jgi:hypothetical protein